jgi:hypothetical protein
VPGQTWRWGDVLIVVISTACARFVFNGFVFVSVCILKMREEPEI